MAARRATAPSQALDRVTEGQATPPRELLGGERSGDPAGNRPEVAPYQDRRPIDVTQCDRDGTGQPVPGHPVGPALRLSPDGVHAQSRIRRRPVRTRRPESDVRNK